MRELFGERLKNVLTERRMQQNELAKKIGASTRTVNAYCQGNAVPSLEKLTEISKALNVSSDYLLGLSNELTEVEKTTFTEDVAVIRRAYSGMSEKQRQVILELVESIIEPD